MKKSKFEENFPELARKAKEERKKRKKPERKNPDLRPKIRVAWGQLSKDQRKAVLRLMTCIGNGAQWIIDTVKEEKSWKGWKGHDDPMVLIGQAFADTGDDLPPTDDWLDAKSTGKDTNVNQLWDTGGVIEVVVFALVLQVLHRTTK